MRAAAAQATAEQRRLAAADDTFYLAQLRASGVTIVPPEEIDTAVFRSALAHVGITAGGV